LASNLSAALQQHQLRRRNDPVLDLIAVIIQQGMNLLRALSVASHAISFES
jgi:hypothetical protein